MKNATNELYVIDFSTLKFDVFTGTLKVTDLRVFPDSARFEALKAVDSANAVLINVEVPMLLIKNINLKQVVFDELFNIDELKISKPTLQVTNYPELKQEKDSTQKFDPNTLFNKYFKTLRLDVIDLDELTFEYITYTDKANKLFSVDKISVSLQDFFIDSTAVNNPDRLFYSDNIDIVIRDYSYNFPDSLYKMEVKQIAISERKKQIKMDSLEIIPQYGKYEFGREKGMETDRMEVKNNLLLVDHLDFNGLLKQQRFQAGIVKIEGLDLDIFRDKRNPKPDSIRPKTLQQSLRSLQTYLHIDTVQLINAGIRYEEHAEEALESGYIKLNNLHASIYNVTNDSLLINEGKTLQIDARMQLMDQGIVEAHFDIPLNSPSDSYSYFGSLTPTMLPAFNPMLEPAAFVKVESGRVEKMTFQVNANDNIGRGDMEMYYEDLKISFLNQDTGESKGLVQGLKAFVANTFVVKTNNPSGNNFREGEMYFERDKTKSVVNFWWKTLLSGIKSSVGVPDQASKKRKKQERKKDKSV